MVERWWRREALPHETAQNKTVLDVRGYYNDFALEAKNARTSILAQSMCITEGPAASAATKIFSSAPQSVKKTFMLDYYSRLLPDGDKIEAVQKHLPKEETAHVLGHQMTRTKRSLYQFLINAFKRQGVDLVFTNPPKNQFGHVMPFIGRDHIKVGIVDEGKVAYFGGINFDQIGESLDFMVKFTGPVAQKIAEAHRDMYAGHVASDMEASLDNYSRLLIDIGNKGESMILKEAVAMIEGAETGIENTSLVFPDGPIDEALSQKAKKGLVTEVVVSSVNPSRSLLGGGRIFNLVQRKNKLFSKLRKSGAHIVTVPEFVHAKLLIVDRGTPYQKAYFGTHNLSVAGVKAGTREWAIFTTDPELIANLGAFYEKAKSNSPSNR